jgi:hypothetical protein
MSIEKINKQIDQLLKKSLDIYLKDVTEKWNPFIPEYPFIKRARIADRDRQFQKRVKYVFNFIVLNAFFIFKNRIK